MKQATNTRNAWTVASFTCDSKSFLRNLIKHFSNNMKQLINILYCTMFHSSCGADQYAVRLWQIPRPQSIRMTCHHPKQSWCCKPQAQHCCIVGSELISNNYKMNCAETVRQFWKGACINTAAEVYFIKKVFTLMLCTVHDTDLFVQWRLCFNTNVALPTLIAKL